MTNGNADSDGVGIGDVYAKHVQQITIQSGSQLLLSPLRVFIMERPQNLPQMVVMFLYVLPMVRNLLCGQAL